MKKVNLAKFLEAVLSGEAQDESLIEHDNRFHQGHFDEENGTCKLREENVRKDLSDSLISSPDGRATAEAYKKARMMAFGNRTTAGRTTSIGSNTVFNKNQEEYKNKELADAIKETGMNPSSFADANGLNKSMLYDYLSDKRSPVTQVSVDQSSNNKISTWTPTAQILASTLETTPEKLFKEQAKRSKINPDLVEKEFGQAERQSRQERESAHGNDVETLIEGAMSSLKPKERDVITRYFGLNGGNEETFEEIGRSYGVTGVRANAIFREGMGKLRVSNKAMSRLGEAKKIINEIDADRKPATRIGSGANETVDSGKGVLRAIAMDAIKEFEDGE